MLPKFLEGSRMVIAIDVNIKGEIFHLVSSYGPNDNQFKIPFLNRLYVYLSSNKKTIWAGDHNIATNPNLDRYPLHFSPDYGTSRFLDIVRTFDLVDTCRYLFPNGLFFTYKGSGCKSRIDKIIVSSSFVIKEYEQLETSFSDHELIYASLVFDSQQRTGPGVWRNNTKYYSDDKFIKMIKMNFAVHSRCVTKLHNLQQWWWDFKYSLKRMSISHAKQKSILEKRETQMRDQGLNNLTLLLNQNPSSTILFKQYCTLKKDILKQKVASIKEKTFKDDALHLMNGDEPTKAFFDKFKNKSSQKYIKSLKDCDGNNVNDIKGILNIAERYYCDLYSGGHSSIQQSVIDFFLDYVEPNPECNALMDDLIAPITEGEVYNAICSTHNGRSPGPDGLSNEFYKVLFPVIKKDLTDLFNHYLNNGKISSKMKSGLVILIPKGEPYDRIENYRPITLMNCDYKIFNKMY